MHFAKKKSDEEDKQHLLDGVELRQICVSTAGESNLIVQELEITSMTRRVIGLILTPRK